MDFKLSETHRTIRRSARELAESEFEEEAFTWHGEVPHEHRKLLAENGFLGMTLPEEFGGAGMSWMDNQMAMEGIGEVCPDTAYLLSETNSGNLQIIAKFGSEEQKERYLSPVLEGDSFIAIAMSEPEAGSAATDMSTTATEDKDDYVLNGTKAWVSGAPKADAFVTYARMPEGHIGSLLVDRDTPGLTVADPDKNMYGDLQSQLYFDDARIPKSASLVTGPDAFKRQIKTYNVNRVAGIAHNWVIAKWLFEDALEYAQNRQQGGKAIGENQAIQHRLADMAIKLETARYLIYRSLSGDELPGRILSSMSKVYVGEKMHEVADAALQIKAANGFVGDTPESYAYRRLRGYLIAGGTPDIHRNMIAKSLYKTGFPDI
jgi:alkylation response protein AidB-like acyl-CoA dehydrogenase